MIKCGWKVMFIPDARGKKTINKKRESRTKDAAFP